MEGSLKIVRKWGQNTVKTELLNLSNSFHGRTMGAYRLQIGRITVKGRPFLPNTNTVNFNDMEDLRAKVNDKDS